MTSDRETAPNDGDEVARRSAKRVVVCTYSGSNVYAVDSNDLLGDAGRVEIRHAGHSYCLRRTQAGKLILTK